MRRVYINKQKNFTHSKICYTSVVPLDEQLSEAASAGLCGPARPSMKERQWQLRQEAILDAATELIRTKGYNAMTLEDITEAIGISRPTLYLHFKSKEDVAAHVALRNLCDIRDVLASVDPGLPAGERLRQFLRLSLDRRFDQGKIPMYDLTRIKLMHSGSCPELRIAECGFTSALADLIREGQESGEVWKAIRPEMFVLVIIGFIKNLEIDTLIEEKSTNREEIENTVLELLFRK